MNTFLVLDLETTGFSPEKGDTIIDIGAIICDENGIVRRFQSLVSPGSTEVSDFIYTLTGISAEMLSDAPERKKVLEEFKTFLGEYKNMPVIGHNIQFDCNFLNAFGFEFTADNYLDTNDFSTLLYPEIPSHSLEILSSYFQIEHVEKHRAMGDVLASYELFKILKKKYESELGVIYKEQVALLMSKQEWGGRHFFDLTISDATPVHSVNIREEDTTSQYYKPQKLKIFSELKANLSMNMGKFVAIPAFLQPQKALMHATKDKGLKDVIILGSNSDLEHFRECADTQMWHEYLLLLEQPSQLIVMEKIQSLWNKDQLNDAECVLILRILFLNSSDAFIPQSRLKLTHRERNILFQYCLQEDDSEQIKKDFCEYLNKFAVVATSYYQYFHGICSSTLKEREHIVLMSAMCIEPNILDASRSYFTIESFRRSVERLQVFNTYSQEYATILESLLLTVTSSLEKIGKHLSRSQMIQSELANFSEELADLQVFSARGLLALQDSIISFPEEVRKNILTNVVQIEKQLDTFLDRTDINYLYYAKSYNNQVTLFREPKSLEECKEHFLSKRSITMIDSTYLDSFDYFIQVTNYYCLEKDEVISLIEEKIDFEYLSEDEIKLLEKNDIMFFKEHIKNDKKTIVLCNTGTKLDKMFETIYSENSSQDYTVVSFGKTGGTHKVQYMFSNAENGALIAKFSDYLQLPSTTKVDELLLHSLPFPNIQGLYYDQKRINTFEKFTVPMTLKTMREVLYKALQLCPDSKKTIKLYDPRMYTKDYGRQILKDLY
ncbi:MAG: exonuclease domain-containing protein [Candidatus Gracilibacteria bacterium]